MMLPLLLIGVAAVAALLTVAVRADETVNPIAATSPPAAGFDSTAETMTGNQNTAPPSQTEWQLVTLSALCEAQDLLDALENQGVAERELIVLGNSSFAVRWR